MVTERTKLGEVTGAGGWMIITFLEKLSQI